MDKKAELERITKFGRECVTSRGHYLTFVQAVLRQRDELPSFEVTARSNDKIDEGGAFYGEEFEFKFGEELFEVLWNTPFQTGGKTSQLLIRKVGDERQSYGVNMLPDGTFSGESGSVLFRMPEDGAALLADLLSPYFSRRS